MGKDNVAFHTVSFPATILGSGEPWKLVDYSRASPGSTGTAASSPPARSAASSWTRRLKEYPSDYWRYWLVANAPETDDASFTFSGFAGVCNKDLADTFGNFVNRILRFCSARFGDAVPEGGAARPDGDWSSPPMCRRPWRATLSNLEAMQLRRAAAELRELWVLGNVYVDRAAPWTAIKTDKDRAARDPARRDQPRSRLYAIVGSPIIPDTCARLRASARHRDRRRLLAEEPGRAELQTLQPGHKFEVPPPLFKKIAPEEIVDLRAALRRRRGSRGGRLSRR